MKTILKAAKKHADLFTTISDTPCDVTGRDIHEYVQNAFIKGAEFAQQWISVDDRNMPMPKKGDFLIKLENGKVFRMNEDWQDEREIVTRWRPIELN